MDDEVKKEFDKIWEKIKELEISNVNSEELKEEKVPKKESGGYRSLSKEITTFCENFNIEEGDLKYLIDFQVSYPRLTTLPKEKIRKKLQSECLLVLGLIYSKVYQKDLLQVEVRNLFNLSRITTDRMDKLYSSKYFIKFFNKSGKNIKLSWAGEQEGIKKIKEMIKNETDA